MSKLRIKCLGGLALAAVLTAPVLAQDAPSDIPGESDVTDNEIIVEGYTEKQVRNFLWRSIVESNRIVAKRSGPICIGIDNAPDQLAQPLRARIESNLKSLEIATLPVGCRANSVIVFARNAHGFVNWLDKQNSGAAFRALYLPERRRLIDPVRPVYNWHVVVGGGRTERPDIDQSPLLLGGANANSPGPGLRTAWPTRAGEFPADSGWTFSVVDYSVIDGITIEQLGDYLTMQMLVEFRPDMYGSVPSDSILNLFTATGTDPDAAPEMSSLDRTILAEMYAPRDNFLSGAVRASVARASVDRLEQMGALRGEP